MRRQRELFDHRFSARAEEAQREVVRLIEQAEREEELAKQLNAEMNEFFKDSTRIAARVFGSIEEEKAQSIEKQVILEMQDFFHDLAKRVEELVLARRKNQIASAELSSSLEEILRDSLEPLEMAATSAAKHVEQ